MEKWSSEYLMRMNVEKWQRNLHESGKTNQEEEEGWIEEFLS